MEVCFLSKNLYLGRIQIGPLRHSGVIGYIETDTRGCDVSILDRRRLIVEVDLRSRCDGR